MRRRKIKKKKEREKKKTSEIPVLDGCGFSPFSECGSPRAKESGAGPRNSLGRRTTMMMASDDDGDDDGDDDDDNDDRNGSVFARSVELFYCHSVKIGRTLLDVSRLTFPSTRRTSNVEKRKEENKKKKKHEFRSSRWR